MAKTTAATTPPARRIGLTNMRFKLNQDNLFTIYGSNIGSASTQPKKVYLTATKYNWETPTAVTDSGADGLTITARCIRKKHLPHTLAARNAFSDSDGDDDLSVTITFDDGGGTLDVIDCTFTDVEYTP